MRRVLGQVGQITFEKDIDLQVEMAVRDGAAAECVGRWEKNIFGTLEKNVQQGLMRF